MTGQQNPFALHRATPKNQQPLQNHTYDKDGNGAIKKRAHTHTLGPTRPTFSFRRERESPHTHSNARTNQRRRERGQHSSIRSIREEKTQWPSHHRPNASLRAHPPTSKLAVELSTLWKRNSSAETRTHAFLSHAGTGPRRRA